MIIEICLAQHPPSGGHGVKGLRIVENQNKFSLQRKNILVLMNLEAISYTILDV